MIVKVGKRGLFVVHIYIAGELKRPLVTQLSPFKQVKAVYYNDTPIADMKLHLFKGQTWSKDLFENATTDSQGIAVFSICTVDEEPTINLGVREKIRQNQRLSSQNPHACRSAVSHLNHLAHAVGFLLF